MKVLSSLASAAALLAVTAFTQDASVRPAGAAAAALARPAAAKGVRSATSTATVSDVVTAANAFLATLSIAQQGTAVVTYNATNVVKWSNLPCGAQCREGLQLGNLTAAQITAALAVVQAATGTVANDGYDETQQIRAADNNLNTARGGSNTGYGAGIYFIAFVGTPSTTGTWMLQYGGHHLATNVTFANGQFTGATPKFEGVEPLMFTAPADAANVITAGTYTPMGNEASTMMAMVAGLTTAHKATAKLSQTFSDVVLGPGQDGNFPTTKVGVQCSTLTSAEQQLVINAMYPWVQDANDATAAALMATYTAQLASTYISYSGTGLFTTNGDYARIDGPNVWIEFVAQTGVVYNTQTHFHSIWRDHARDYGGNYYTTVLATKTAAAATVFGLYPSPVLTGSDLQVRLTSGTSGTYAIRNLLGQSLANGSFQNGAAAVPTTGMVPGVYLLTVETAGQPAATSRFVVQ